MKNRLEKTANEADECQRKLKQYAKLSGRWMKLEKLYHEINSIETDEMERASAVYLFNAIGNYLDVISIRKGNLDDITLYNPSPFVFKKSSRYRNVDAGVSLPLIINNNVEGIRVYSEPVFMKEYEPEVLRFIESDCKENGLMIGSRHDSETNDSVFYLMKGIRIDSALPVEMAVRNAIEETKDGINIVNQAYLEYLAGSKK